MHLLTAVDAVDAESGKWTARGGHSSKAEDDDPLAGGASNTSSAMWGNCSPETAHRSGTDLQHFANALARCKRLGTFDAAATPSKAEPFVEGKI